MKLVFFLLLTVSLQCAGQFGPDTVHLIPMEKEQSTDTTEIYAITDQMPEFPGGIAAFFMSFRNCLRADSIPEACGRGCIYIHLKFIVEKDGSLSGISIRSRRCDFPGLETACLEKLYRLPAWTPGRPNGQPVRTYMDIPLRIRVN